MKDREYYLNDTFVAPINRGWTRPYLYKKDTTFVMNRDFTVNILSKLNDDGSLFCAYSAPNEDIVGYMGIFVSENDTIQFEMRISSSNDYYEAELDFDPNKDMHQIILSVSNNMVFISIDDKTQTIPIAVNDNDFSKHDCLLGKVGYFEDNRRYTGSINLYQMFTGYTESNDFTDLELIQSLDFSCHTNWRVFDESGNNIHGVIFSNKNYDMNEVLPKASEYM